MKKEGKREGGRQEGKERGGVGGGRRGEKQHEEEKQGWREGRRETPGEAPSLLNPKAFELNAWKPPSLYDNQWLFPPNAHCHWWVGGMPGTEDHLCPSLSHRLPSLFQCLWSSSFAYSMASLDFPSYFPPLGKCPLGFSEKWERNGMGAIRSGYIPGSSSSQGKGLESHSSMWLQDSEKIARVTKMIHRMHYFVCYSWYVG